MKRQRIYMDHWLYAPKGFFESGLSISYSFCLFVIVGSELKKERNENTFSLYNELSFTTTYLACNHFMQYCHHADISTHLPNILRLYNEVLTCSHIQILHTHPNKQTTRGYNNIHCVARK